MPTSRQEEKEIKELINKIIDAAEKIHKTMGPGLLENAYQTCLNFELKNMGMEVILGKNCPVKYDGIKIDAGYKIDMIVEDRIVIENKTIQRISSDDEEELYTYLKFSGYKVGLLINWRTALIKQSIKRIDCS